MIKTITIMIMTAITRTFNVIIDHVRRHDHVADVTYGHTKDLFLFKYFNFRVRCLWYPYANINQRVYFCLLKKKNPFIAIWFAKCPSGLCIRHGRWIYILFAFAFIAGPFLTNFLSRFNVSLQYLPSSLFIYNLHSIFFSNLIFLPLFSFPFHFVISFSTSVLCQSGRWQLLLCLHLTADRMQSVDTSAKLTSMSNLHLVWRAVVAIVSVYN